MRVKPIVQFGLVAGMLALPGAAYPLGLGKLTVDSFVGQPLSARIELLPSSKEELDSVTAKVAEPSLYRQNNLQYQGVLGRTRIVLERGTGSTAYLKITSQQPVVEPYLDLLVEVNWASGRVVRDYTFLLDPPGSVAATPVEPMTPTRQGAAPRAQPAPVAAAAAAPARGEGNSYTVKRGDTLSRIAVEYKPETVTLEQMLVALFRSNEAAFDGSNMNRLRSGTIITIPNAVEASNTPPAEAAQVVSVQATDWRAYRDRVAGSAPMAEEGRGRAAAGRIGTAVQETAPAAKPGSGELRVSKEAGTAKGTTAEAAAARDAQLRDAQSRIAELEKTLKDLQRAVEMRNQTLAQMQADAGKAAKATTAPPVTAPPPKAAEPAIVEPPKVEPPKAAEPAKVEAPKVEEPAKVGAPMVAEPPKAAEPAKVEPPKVVPPKAVPPAKAAAAKEPPGFFEDLLGNTPGWAIGAGALVVLGGIAALLAARRRKTTKFEDSIISGTDIKTNTVFGSTGGGVVNTGDNSLASDFSREGLGNIDTDEVDPIAEAEVYLAYGRDAQAEEILKDALKKDPQRQEIYLKLLEIHAQHNKPSAFETVASELYSVTSGQGETWQKAVALGRQLDPNNPMFADGGTPGARSLAGAAAVAAAADSIEIDESREGLEYQMDEEISISPASGAQPKSPADILAGAESEVEKSVRGSSSMIDTAALEAGAVSTGFAGGAADVVDEAAAEGRSSLDTLGAKFDDRIEPVKSAAVEATKFDLDFKLDDSEKPEPMIKRDREPAPEPVAAGATSSQLARPAAALELDKLDLSFDPERTTFEDPTPSVLDGQWHDAATKLDLAKAYQEMGDVEGAREILQEVLHEGDDQQKAEAKSLLAKLG